MRGGKRKGSGRKKGKPTETISVRHDKEIVDKVKTKYKKQLPKLIKGYINKLERM